MNIGQAVETIKRGGRVARAGWNGKGMYLFYVASWTYTDGRQDNFPNLPFIAMKTATGEVVPWLASQTDILAEDWEGVGRSPLAAATAARSGEEGARIG